MHGTDPPLRAPDTPSLVALGQSRLVATPAPEFASPRVITDYTVLAHLTPGDNPAIFFPG
jgi:hypothetical protein